MLSMLSLYVAIAASVGYFGRDRTFGFWGYFVISLLLTPMVGVLCALASDRRTKTVADSARGTGLSPKDSGPPTA